jgi:stage V sporulation protein B
LAVRVANLAAVADTDRDVARKAGRGGLAVATAKIYFILVGLVQQVILPRVLGLAGYGGVSSVLSIAGIAYNPIVSTSIQGVSRAVAQAPDAEQPQAIRRVLTIHLWLALPLAFAFLVLAPGIGHAVGAPHLVPSLRIMAGVILFYSLYAPLVGVLNGQKRFVSQAGLDMLAATVRTLALVGGGVLLAKSAGSGAGGASIGFVGATAVMFLVALGVVGAGKAGRGGPATSQHLSFIAPLLIGQTLLNLLLQADLTLLRAFAAQSAKAIGLGPEAADKLVGAYRATQLFSFLPYQLLLAVTFILFPMLATAERDRDREAVARYVRAGVRLALVLAGAMVSVTSGLSGPLMRLVFGAEAAELGTRSMQLLTLGFGAFAIFGILTTVLNSLKREVASMLVTAVAFALVVGLCFLRVRGADFGPELLFRTAFATTSGLVLATVVAGLLVHRAAGAVAPLASFVRVILAMAIAIAIGRQVSTAGKVMTVVYAAAVGVVYLAVLTVSRELGKADIAMVKNVLGSKQGPITDRSDRPGRA